MKRDPFGQTIKRRNAREDKLWRKYRHRSADEFFSRIGWDRGVATANRNMVKELARIRALRGTSNA